MTNHDAPHRIPAFAHAKKRYRSSIADGTTFCRSRLGLIFNGSAHRIGWCVPAKTTEGTFSQPMPIGQRKTIPPTNKSFALSMVTIGHWKDGVMIEEWLMWHNQVFMKQLGLAQYARGGDGHLRQDPRRFPCAPSSRRTRAHARTIEVISALRMPEGVPPSKRSSCMPGSFRCCGQAVARGPRIGSRLSARAAPPRASYRNSGTRENGHARR
jgi:hypothetical protein